MGDSAHARLSSPESGEFVHLSKTFCKFILKTSLLTRNLFRDSRIQWRQLTEFCQAVAYALIALVKRRPHSEVEARSVWM